jgi:hydroxyacylglutathione hydrolase
MKKLIISSFVATVFLISCAFKPAEYKFEPLPTGKITDNVWAVNDKFVNVFVIANGSKYIVIDAGSNVQHVESELEMLKISPDDVEAVLLTHTHPDHIAAASIFKNATIYVSAFEADKIADRQLIKLNSDTIFKIGQTEITAISTPGHTPGSVSYVVDKQYLFTGDAFSLSEGKVSRPNAQYTKDMPVAVKSFDKIKRLKEAKYIFTAHTGMTNDYLKAVQTEL